MQTSLVTNTPLELFGIYWIKLKGYSIWPAVYEGMNGHKKYVFHFFGDGKFTQVTRNSIHDSFATGFVKYEKIYNANQKLNKAVKEATVCSLKQQSKTNKKKETTCFICDLSKNCRNMPQF